MEGAGGGCEGGEGNRKKEKVERSGGREASDIYVPGPQKMPPRPGMSLSFPHRSLRPPSDPAAVVPHPCVQRVSLRCSATFPRSPLTSSPPASTSSRSHASTCLTSGFHPAVSSPSFPYHRPSPILHATSRPPIVSVSPFDAQLSESSLTSPSFPYTYTYIYLYLHPLLFLSLSLLS